MCGGPPSPTILRGSLPLELEVEVAGAVDHGHVEQVVDSIGLPGAQDDILVRGEGRRVHLQCLIVLGTRGRAEK